MFSRSDGQMIDRLAPVYSWAINNNQRNHIFHLSLTEKLSTNDFHEGSFSEETRGHKYASSGIRCYKILVRLDLSWKKFWDFAITREMDLFFPKPS